MPKATQYISNIMVWLLIMLSYIPMLTIFAFKDESRVFMYAVTLFWISVFLLLCLPRVNLPSLKESKIFYIIIFVSLGVFVFFSVYKYSGISFNFNLTKVYDIRSLFSKAKIPLSGYFFNWTGYVVNVALFALLIKKKKWIYASLVVIFQLLLFSATGNKTFLFALPFALFVMWITSRKNPLFYFASGMLGLLILAILSNIVIDDLWLSSLITRRTLLVPAQLSFYYFDFYLSNGPILLSHSVFRFFLDYPYPLRLPNLIGKIYFDKPLMAANNGIVGDAVINFGLFGLALWSILLVTVLKLIDSCSKGKDIKIGIATVLLPTIALTNSALLTGLLTHGLLLALLILYLFPKENTELNI